GGIPVVIGAYNKFSPAIIPSGEGGWIIAWIDQFLPGENLFLSSGPYYSDRVIMQKFDENGNVLWVDNDDPDLPGVLVAESEEDIGSVKCFSDNDGGAISLWAARGDDGTDIFAQRLNPEGEVAEGWSDECTVIAGGEGNQGSTSGGIAATGDSEGGIIFCWSERGEHDYGFIYANSIDSHGNLTWDENPDGGVVVCNTEEGLGGPTVCPDGLGGAFCAWRDRRNDQMYDIYCQRLNEDGEILWTENGEVICDTENRQLWPAIVNVSPGAAVMVWKNDPPLGDFEYYSDIYMQKVSGTDSITIHWEENGLFFSRIENINPKERIAADGSGGVIVVWGDLVTDDYGVYTQLIDPDGERTWAGGDDVVVISGRYNGGDINSILVNDHTATITWNDWRTGSSEVFRQRIDIESGDILLPENGSTLASGISGDAKNPKIVRDDDVLWFAWEDRRQRYHGNRIYVQKAAISNGNIEFEANGICVIEEPDNPENSFRMDSKDIALDNFGGLLLAWADLREDDYRLIYTQRIDQNGELLWNDLGNPVIDEGIEIEPEHGLTDPRILPTPDGGMYVVFHKDIGVDYYEHILMQKLSPDGEPEWTGEDHGALLITDSDFDHHLEGMACFNDGTVLLVYTKRDYFYHHTDLYAQRIDSDGNILWDEEVIVSDAPLRQSDCQIANVSDGVLIVWMDHRYSRVDSDIWGQVIFPDSRTRWEDNGIVLIETDRDEAEISLGVRSDEEWSFWLAWTVYAEAYDHDLYTQRFDWQGTPFLEPASGVPVCTTANRQYEPKIIVGSEQDANITWVEYTGSGNYDLEYTHLGSDGEPIADRYNNNGVTLCDARLTQFYTDIVPDGEGGFVAVWQDARSSNHPYSYDIYAQRVNDGLVGINNDNSAVIPEKWSLEAVYPNPFNSSLNIKVGLPQDSRLQIKLYNILGKEAATITDGFYKAGFRRFSFNSEELASGVYFINAGIPGKMSKIRKVLLVK
ncbi:MAG: T9SS type A sorting domain-containing protein, partial [Candidatus Electryonea clarkiae]|nr:T9SS type A sorting domain-containing protein [Candidatus Electryonea clarkiae]